MLCGVVSAIFVQSFEFAILAALSGTISVVATRFSCSWLLYLLACASLFGCSAHCFRTCSVLPILLRLFVMPMTKSMILFRRVIHLANEVANFGCSSRSAPWKREQEVFTGDHRCSALCSLCSSKPRRPKVGFPRFHVLLFNPLLMVQPSASAIRRV